MNIKLICLKIDGMFSFNKACGCIFNYSMNHQTWQEIFVSTTDFISEIVMTHVNWHNKHPLCGYSNIWTENQSMLEVIIYLKLPYSVNH